MNDATLVWTVFSLVLVTWLFQFAYFANRWRLRRNPQSIAISVATLGWPLMIARELKLVRVLGAAPLVVLALVGGALGMLIIVRWEAQRPSERRWR